MAEPGVVHGVCKVLFWGALESKIWGLVNCIWGEMGLCIPRVFATYRFVSDL